MEPPDICAMAGTAASASGRAIAKAREDQLCALGLVANVIVLWNTIYMDAAFDQLRADGARRS
jgi:TnpA family transposase